MAPICLPMNAFVRGETPLCFDIFPLDRNWGRGKEGTAVSFYCFYLSSHLRRFFFYLSSLKLNNKKALIFIITHYYFQTKTSHQKNSERKEISRNVTWLHVWIQSEGKGQWERSRKYLWKPSFRWLRSIPLPTHTLISHYRLWLYKVARVEWKQYIYNNPLWTHIFLIWYSSLIIIFICRIQFSLSITPLPSLNFIDKMEYKKVKNL